MLFWCAIFLMLDSCCLFYYLVLIILVSTKAIYLLSLFFFAINRFYKTMTIKQLRAFLAVAENLSFIRACEQLHLSQPALSLAIKSLEESLGGALLIRTTRSVALTPEGKILVQLARRLLRDWDNAEEQLKQHFTLQLGSITVAAFPSFAANLLPAALKIFCHDYPNIKVTVNDVVNEQVVDKVRDRHVELGVVLEPPAMDGLIFTPLYVDRFIAVVPAASPLANLAIVDWARLLDAPFIALQRPSAVRRLLEESISESYGALPVAFESHQLATIGNMIASGLGVSVVPQLCQPQMAALGAVCLPLENPVIEQRVGFIQLTGTKLSSAAQAMAEILLGITSKPL